MKYRNVYIALALLLGGANAIAQDEERSSSSLYLSPADKADVSVPFWLSGEGKQFHPTWGLDLAWINKQNLLKGLNHMGKSLVNIGRTSFRVFNPLVNDVTLTTDMIEGLQERSSTFDLVNPNLPLVFNCDNGYVPYADYPDTHINPYYTINRNADVGHWAAVINAHLQWMKKNSTHPIVGISPFNEPDLDGQNNELIQGTKENQADVAKKLREDYADAMKDVILAGGNTLNNDKALDWYTAGKDYYDWGNTHQLAGSMDTYINFHRQLQQDGKVGYNDEMHNIVEPMVGLEYGMTVGIWWGFDSRARGEFCDMASNGVRLAYREHRDKWTAGAVYRHNDGRVKAFIGTSERQAKTTKFQFVSPEQEVYFDGFGPTREYNTTVYGADGYGQGQTNTERVIDVTWGDDVQPAVINGTYRIVNRATKAAVSWSGNGQQIAQSALADDEKQMWTITPCRKTTIGDKSFYDIEALNNGNVRMNVRDYSTASDAQVLAWTQEGPTSNEQWYLQYAGDGYYYIRNRESALYLTSVGTAQTSKIVQSVLMADNSAKRQQWRLLPPDVKYETTKPKQPTNLLAENQQASVRLSWTAPADKDLAGYMIARTPKGTDKWNTIARKVTTTNYVDHTCRTGNTYIYKVRAIDKAENLSAYSDEVEACPSGSKGLMAIWRFDDSMNDETPNMMDAASYGSVGYASGKIGKAIDLTSQNGFVQLPYEVASYDEMTITMWVKWQSSENWQRIFDFGNDTEHYMFLTPLNSYTDKMRFAIKNGGDEQTLDCKRLGTGNWTHVAVVIGKDTTTIYLGGKEAASSTGITIKPSDFCPVLNYIGRSQFPSDGYFRGYIDDFRIYNHALDADAVKGTMQEQPADIDMPTAESSQKSTTYGLDGRRYDAPRKGVHIVDGKKIVK